MVWVHCSVSIDLPHSTVNGNQCAEKCYHCTDDVGVIVVFSSLNIEKKGHKIPTELMFYSSMGILDDQIGTRKTT